MALKTWIDDIKPAQSGTESEVQLEPVGAAPKDYLPGEKEADEILFGARDEIIKGGVFHFTQETQAAEITVNRTYKAILDGGRDFEALRVACTHWSAAARKAPVPPVMASLFEGLKK
ncbi:MAG: hypothetical protein FD159_909 [Syntrophaceae bacterium]|nr:MAG: hypothetical protein FD159_909 [Syntrophaceae bacterium]